MLDADGNAITTVSLDGAYYKIEVKYTNKSPFLDAKVSFSIDAEGVALSQTTSGYTLTNSEGKARIFLKPNAPKVSGAYTISANASYKGNTAADNLDFSVQATNVTLSVLTMGTSLLPSGAQTTVSFKVSDIASNPLSGILTNLNSGGFYDLNPMPSETTISATIIDKTAGVGSGSCAIELIGGVKVVPDNMAVGKLGNNIGTINTYRLQECEAGDSLEILFTSPNNETTTRTYIIE